MAVTDLTTSFYAGNRHVLEFTVVDQDTSGEPALDITGKSFQFALSKIINGVPKDTPFLEYETGSGITTTDAANGEVEVEIAAADTADVKPGTYYFELEMLAASGPADPIVVATGNIEIKLNVANT